MNRWIDKRIYQFLFLFFSFFVFSGCKHQEEKKQPEVLPTPTFAVSQSEEEENSITADASKVITPVTSGLKEKVEEIKDTQAAYYNGFNRKETWISHISLHDAGALFCLMEDGKTIYYVNIGQDYFLYRLKDGVSKLAVAMPICALQQVNGVLYFMVHSSLGGSAIKEFQDGYDVYTLDGMKNGDIYSYCPETGEVKPICAADAIIFYAEEKGLHFMSSIQQEKGSYRHFYMPFDTGTAEQEWGKLCLFPWKDNWVVHKSGIDGIRLVKRENPEETEDYIPDIPISKFCIAKDELFYLNYNGVGKFNLETKEHTILYDAKKNNPENLQNFIDFTITEDGFLWLCNGTTLYQVNLTNGELIPFYSTVGGHLIRLYTDGTEIYVCYATESNPSGQIAKLSVTIDKERNFWTAEWIGQK